jgi:hypothetical protein
MSLLVVVFRSLVSRRVRVLAAVEVRVGDLAATSNDLKAQGVQRLREHDAEADNKNVSLRKAAPVVSSLCRQRKKR